MPRPTTAWRAPRVRLTYANVTATLALFIALGGSSFAAPVRHAAASLITGKQIKNGSVAEIDLSSAVKAKLAKAGTPGPKGDTGSTGPQGPKGETGPAGPIAGVVAGGALAGTYPNPQLGAGVVGATQLADGAVGSTQLAAGAVGTTQLAPGAVTAAAIANVTITAAQIANATITGTQIASNAITSSKVMDHQLSKDDVGYGFTQLVDLGPITAASCDSFAFDTNAPNGISSGVATINAPPNFFNANGGNGGLVYNWSIGNSSGQIAVHVCNATNATIDPASGLWKAVLFDS